MNQPKQVSAFRTIQWPQVLAGQVGTRFLFIRSNQGAAIGDDGASPILAERAMRTRRTRHPRAARRRPTESAHLLGTGGLTT